MNITITDNLGVVLNAEIEVMTRKVISMAVDDRVSLEIAYAAMAVLSGVLEAESMRGPMTNAECRMPNAGAASPLLRKVRPEAPTCEGGCE